MAKSIGKSLVGLFVQQVEDPKAAEAPTPAAAVEIPKVAPVPTNASTPAGIADAQVAEMLGQVLEQANMEGFDYFEFAKMLDQLKPTLPSEQVLFTTAFISGKVMGASKEHLIKTAQSYLEVLNKKSQEFNDACQAKIQETVVSREDELKNMDAAIQEKAASIQKLTEEINAMTTQKMKISNEIAENRLKIESKKSNFSATLSLFTDRISADISKINKYVQ